MDIDVFVPAEGIPRLVSFNGCAEPSNTMAGNSHTGPLVAGVIALMRSVNPCLSPGEIENILKVSFTEQPNGAAALGITTGILDAELAVMNAQNFEWTDVEITSTDDQTIDDPRMITGNLVIKTGADVTITSTVTFNTNSRLIVERGARLTVDGGVLTVNQCCGDQWRGVLVEGNTALEQPFYFSSLVPEQAGILRLENGAVIEFAKNAVSTRNTQHLWPMTKNYYGGLISANNATFRNNIRAVEIMKYGIEGKKDKSKFENCVFQNHHSTVTIWSSNGVTFENNLFEDFSKRGILSYDSEIFVRHGNIFNGDIGEVIDEYSTSIDIVSTHPNVFGSSIGTNTFAPNEFNDGFYAIFIESDGNTDKVRIQNNEFNGGVYGVHFHNATHFSISHNVFSGYSHAIRAVQTGSFNNIQSWNDIQDCEIGTYIWHSNPGFVFSNNCYDNNDIADFVMVGESANPDLFPGSIFAFQGDEDGLPAGNTFSKGNTDAIIIDGGDPGDVMPFTYYIPEGTLPNSDLHPTPNDDPYNMLTILDESNPQAVGQCGLLGPAPPPGPSICTIPDDLVAIQQEITDIQNEIDQSSDAVPDKELCLRNLKLALVRAFVISDEEEDLFDYFEAETDFLIKSTLYGYLVKKGVYTEAETYLNNLNISETIGTPTSSNDGEDLTEEQIDFIEVQKINLKRLSEGSNFALSSQEMQTIMEVAQKGRSLDGYARGLYMAIREKRLPFTLPDFNKKLKSREEVITGKVAGIQTGPNPVRNIFSIKFTEKQFVNQIEVWNVQGQRIFTDRLNENALEYHLNTTSFQAGVYFLKLSADNETIYETKLIKL